MNEKQLRAILHSDIELWEAATEENGEKFLMLPYGIGKVAISLEDIEYGPKRAQAVGSFGSYIRGVVKDKTADEAIESRASAALKSTGNHPGELSLGSGDDSNSAGVGSAVEVQEVSDQKAVASLDETPFTPEGMASRAGSIRELIVTYEEYVSTLSAELKGVEAYLEAFNAPADKKTPRSD